MTQRYRGAPRNDLAGLCGARMAVASETSQGATFDEATVKQLTGQDTISCRFLYGEFFQYKPQFKIWFATNSKPRIRETTDAIWRRIRLIPFNQQFKKDRKDSKLLHKLEAELPGILAWAVKGCLEWQKVGLGLPKQVLDATNEYKRESDQVGRFINERCEKGSNLSIPAKTLYGEYGGWCQHQGEEKEPNNKFAGRIAAHGFTKKRTSAGYIYEGLGLKNNGQK